MQEWVPNAKPIGQKIKPLIRDLCEHLRRQEKNSDQLGKVLARALVDLKKLDPSVPLIDALDCQEYLNYIDLDFIESQKKTPRQHDSNLEAYLDAIIYSDQLKISVSPFQILCKTNESYFKTIFSKQKSVTNYQVWKVLKEIEQIRIPHTFTRLAERDRISYGELMELCNTPLYYSLFRQQLISNQLLSKAGRLMIRNPAQLTFIPSQNPQISIVIPVYGSYDLLNQTLISLHRMIAAEGITYEVICVDDCSPDFDQSKYAAYQGLHLIQTKNNLGFSGACNEGAKAASGQTILFLNSDTIVCHAALSSVVALFTQHADVAIIGSRLLNMDFSLQEAGGIVWANGEAAKFGRGALPRLPEFEFVRNCDYVSGAALFIKKTIWEELHGFDDEFAPAYYEDTDLCMRANQKGYRVVYCPQSNVIHAEGGTNGVNLASGVKRYQNINKKKFIKRHKEYLLEHQPAVRDFPGHLIARRKVIIFVDHYIPKHDRDAGSKATFDFLEYLVEQDYFVIFWPDNLSPDPNYYQAISDLGVMVISGAQYIGKLTEFIKPYEHAIDRIFLSRPHIAHRIINSFNQELKAKTFYIGHDIHYERLRREYEQEFLGNNQWLIYSDPELIAQHRTQEILLWKACQQALYFTQRECDIVKQTTGAKASLIPLYSPKRLTRLMEIGRAASYTQRKSILYVGGFAHSPNLDAMNWLLSGVKKGDPWLSSFLLIGSKIPESLMVQIENLGIQYQSNISNHELEQLHYSAKLVLAPIRYGSGLKGKVIEAIASYTPVISTSIGLEGLSDDGKSPAFDQLRNFIEAIDFYSNDPNAWEQLQTKQVQLLERYLKSARYENALEL